jgi:hypothetical protein
MAIKKFSAYIAEGTGTSAASNFVAPKDDDQEVKGYKPRSKGEEDFANAHTVTKHDYPVDVEAQFTGGVDNKPQQQNNGEPVQKQGSTDVNQPQGGGDSKRTADKKQGDMKPVNPVKEEVELEEAIDLTEGKVMDGLKQIVDKKSAGSVKFANGKTLKVDMTTANAMLNLYKKINDKNKKKMEDQIEKSPDVFMKLMDVAFGGK